MFTWNGELLWLEHYRLIMIDSIALTLMKNAIIKIHNYFVIYNPKLLKTYLHIGITDESSSGFQCYDGTWIPSHSLCDGQRDCAGKNWEDEPMECCKNLFCCRKVSFLKTPPSNILRPWFNSNILPNVRNYTQVARKTSLQNVELNLIDNFQIM